jgi:inorganic pyrophosphatase
MLFTSTRYPYDYGFVKNTLSLDGDPLDALVMLDEPTFPGCVVSVRAIGMFNMTDEAGGDDKLLCVAAGDIRKASLQDITDVPEYELSEIQQFFEVYKALEPGKSVSGGNWVNCVEAQEEIERSRKRFTDLEH